MREASIKRSIILGLVLAFGSTLAWRFSQRAPEIAVAWGNAFAERERRGAAEDARRAEAEKVAQAQRAANEDYNEAHCKVTIQDMNAFGRKTEVVTNVRRIEPTMREYRICFGGGVSRYVTIIKTEDCR